MISFIGAGPGNPDLITLRALDRIKKAEIIIYAGSLIPVEMMSHATTSAIYDSSIMTLEDVLGIYKTNKDKSIARLHSGDPSLYGAIQEQISYCEQNDISYEIIPGVSSLFGASAELGIELTQPGVSQSVVITRLARRTSQSMPQKESIATYASAGGTLAIFLSGSNPEMLQEQLLSPDSAFNESTPAAVIYRVSWPEQKIKYCALGTLAETMREMGEKLSVLIIVGDVLAKTEYKRSHLYNPEFSHKFRNRSALGETKGIASKQYKPDNLRGM